MKNIIIILYIIVIIINNCNGKCSKYGDCKNINMLSWLDVTKLGWPKGTECTSMWGWIDDRTNKKYIIQSCEYGHTMIDISDPYKPKAIGKLFGENGGKFKWRDVKVYKDHAFMVSDTLLSRVQVLDLKATVDGTNKRKPKTKIVSNDNEYEYDDNNNNNNDRILLRGLQKSNDIPILESAAVYLGGGIYQSHNIAINEDSGYAYAVGGGNNCQNGVHMINIQDPKNPTFAGCYWDKQQPYVHDALCLTYTKEHLNGKYNGREICFLFSVYQVSAVDVTNKKEPKLLSSLSYDGASYVHQGWNTVDRNFLIVDDERDAPGIGIKTFIVDIRDINDLKLSHVHTALGEKFGDHNQYVIQIGEHDYTFQANYAGGLRVLRINRDIVKDIEQVVSLEEVAFFDSNPANHNLMEGVWSVYPFFTDEKLVIVTDMDTGFFILRWEFDDSVKAIPYAKGVPTPSPTSWANCDQIKDKTRCNDEIACKWDWDWQAVVGWREGCSHQPGSPKPIFPYRAPPGGANACNRLNSKQCNMYPACFLKSGCRAFPY